MAKLIAVAIHMSKFCHINFCQNKENGLSTGNKDDSPILTREISHFNWQ